MQLTTITSVFRAAALFAIVGLASAYPSSTINRRQSPNSFNFDFEHSDTGDVGTIVWPLSTLPITHPLVGAPPPPRVDAETTGFARNAFQASVTGEDIYCEMFQNEDCTRSAKKPSYCIVGERFQRTGLDMAPPMKMWPLEMHGQMKCLVCDSKSAKEACKETGPRS